MTAPQFVPGLELSRRFFEQEVEPALGSAYPELLYGAALLGRGSEVLGFDDAVSRDHNWEPRVLIFLRPEDHSRNGEAIGQHLRRAVPAQFAGQATDYSIFTVQHFFRQHLEIDTDSDLEARDWLTLPEQRLRMITAGAVFRDQVGLQSVRDRLSYYPHDVWLYLLAAGWWRVHPEINLVGRAGSVADELGSALIGNQLVQDLMRLCFLMERQYAPYSKWFGTAFSHLRCAAELSPVLWQVVRAETWPERESALLAAYEQLGAMHNALRITPPVRMEVLQMWDRPFRVLWGDFPDALKGQIRDPAVSNIAAHWPVGGIDQVRELLWAPHQHTRLLRLLDE